MRLFRYLFQHKAALAGVIALLFVQAFCDLSLPNYTSDIVDVGIQQKGIEHAALTDMSADTYRMVHGLADSQQRAVLDGAYERAQGGSYHLTDAGRQQMSELDSIETPALAALAAVSGGSGSAASSGEDWKQMERMMARAKAGTATDAQAQQFQQAATREMGEGQGSVAWQRAIAFDQSEYQQLGVSLEDLQMSYLVREGAQMLLMTLLLAAASASIGLLASRTAARIGRDLREHLFAKVMSFSFAEMDKFSSASLITRSTNDIQQIQMTCVFLMRMVFYAPIIGIGGVIVVAQTNVGMTWVIALAVMVIIGGVALLVGLTMPKFKIMQSLIDRVNLVAREMLTGVSVIRAFRRGKHEQERFQQASGDLMKAQLFTNRVMTAMQPFLTIVMNGVSVLIVWTAASQIDLGAMQVGDMIAFITYAMLIIMSFLMLSMVAIMLPRASVAAGRVEEVLNTKASIADPEKPVDFAAVERKAGDHAGTVEFDHVYFRYGTAERNTLHDISFTAEPGKTTAIIGSTGSGKSTLLNLIPRFYDVTQGAVRIDGVDVRAAKQADIRATVGYVPQKGVLFSGTIASNLKFAGDQVSDERMREAAQAAQAAEFIGEKEDGYDMPIAQGGTNVSGGQKQRLGIARALAADTPILLFDDSFSALDYRTDAKLREALAECDRKATVIIVAQRVATIMHADQILVLNEGRLVGKGTHEQLLGTCKAYREIAASQLSERELAQAVQPGSSSTGDGAPVPDDEQREGGPR
jgi:ATP-binding cassette subfamily B multidrug efflux pump